MSLDPENKVHNTWLAVKDAAASALREIRQRQQEVWEAREGGEWDDLLDMQEALQRLIYTRDPWSDWPRASECVHGGVYAIRSRNLSFGVWNSNTLGFVGIREKFGSEYLFTEYHYDTGGSFGTARPVVLVETCPIEDLAEGHVKCDKHDRPVEFRHFPEGQGGYRVHSDDESLLITDKNDPEYCQSFHYNNKPLFDFLKGVEERHLWEKLTS